MHSTRKCHRPPMRPLPPTATLRATPTTLTSHGACGRLINRLTQQRDVKAPSIAWRPRRQFLHILARASCIIIVTASLPLRVWPHGRHVVLVVAPPLTELACIRRACATRFWGGYFESMATTCPRRYHNSFRSATTSLAFDLWLSVLSPSSDVYHV